MVFKEAKRKRVYALEEGLDYKVEEVTGGYDPKKERKLVLTRLGPADTCSGEDEVEAAQHDKRRIVQEAHLQTASPKSDHLISAYQHLRDASNDNGNLLIEEIPSSFEVAGHVAHVNLREESLPYKYLIGKAILEKNKPKIRVV
eukprot:scaffold32342_cov75-Skeletonema_marinoi.AAC.1